MSEARRPRDHRGRAIDFGSRADDYLRHRPGFPDRFFDEIERRGWIRAGLRALDLGAGTGALALAWARRGLDTTALDISEEMLRAVDAGARAAGVRVATRLGSAEATGLGDRAFDLVSAGQCWWWFDPLRALVEIDRVLAPDGRLLICNFSYLPLPGSLADRTEALVLRFNPGWPKAGWRGIHPEQVRALDEAGFSEVESFSFVENVPFTHEAWRGRIRACNGVGAALPDDDVRRFDRALREMLERERVPSPIRVPHRVFAVSGMKRGGRTAPHEGADVGVRRKPG